MKAQALDTFGIDITVPLRIVPLHSANLLSPDRWPRFTMLGQSAGSIYVAWECVNQVLPEVWFSPVIMFSKLNEIFLGYFDPVCIIC